MGTGNKMLGGGNTPSQLHATETGISSGSVGQFGSSVALPDMVVTQVLRDDRRGRSHFCHQRCGETGQYERASRASYFPTFSRHFDLFLS